MKNQCSCSDSLFEMPIGIEILISEESLYFTHYPCRCLGPTDVPFKRYYKRKCIDSLKNCGYHHF